MYQKRESNNNKKNFEFKEVSKFDKQGRLKDNTFFSDLESLEED